MASVTEDLIRVVLLGGEWGSKHGVLSAFNREFAIQLAKQPNVRVSILVPHCDQDEKNAALSYGISLVQAITLEGFDEIDCLPSPPDNLPIDLPIDFVIGYGFVLGHHAQVIRQNHKCKWIQFVHIDSEELVMFKDYPDAIPKGEKKHEDEVALCVMADCVVAFGPKQAEAYRSYLRLWGKDQDVFVFTPGIFSEFSDIVQSNQDRGRCQVLALGNGDPRDFSLKGFGIVTEAVGMLNNAFVISIGGPDKYHTQVAESLEECNIPQNRGRKWNLSLPFHQVDIAIMPSSAEDFGLDALEAMSAGLPVLVSDNSGFGEALKKVKSGPQCVVSSEDATVWAEKMKEILSRDRENRLKTAKELCQNYEKKYSWEQQCRELVAKMEKILKAAPQHQSPPTTAPETAAAPHEATGENHVAAGGEFETHVKDFRGNMFMGDYANVIVGATDSSTDALKGCPPLLTDDDLITLTMRFEEEHKECVRVLPYRNEDGQIEVHLYVYSGMSGVSEDLKEAAKEVFPYKEVNLRWLDLYNKGSIVLKVKQLEYPSGKPGRLKRVEVEKISEIISKNLHVFSKYRNVTAVQPSLKVTNSEQTTESCVAVYVLGKGRIPIGESEIPLHVGGYRVDVVDGFWYRTGEPWKPTDAQKPFNRLRLGASIGVKGKEASGTLGAILEDENNRGTFYLLSCDHVLNGGKERQIIHPGLNDHLNLAEWNLTNYMQGLSLAAPGPRAGEILKSVDGNLDTDLSVVFKFLTDIQEEHIKLLKDDKTNPEEITFKDEEDKRRFRYYFPGDDHVRRQRLEILLDEKVPELEELKQRFVQCLQNPPRDVATFTKGIRDNVQLHPDDEKYYYVDAAIAKLTPAEVDKLRKRGTVEVVGTKYYPNGKCTPATTDGRKKVRVLCKSGRTTGFTKTEDRLRGSEDPPLFLMDNPTFRLGDNCLYDSMKPGHFQQNSGQIKTIQSKMNEPEEPFPQQSEESENGEAGGPDKHWLHNCLCIVGEKHPFADDGDSGAVIFEKCYGNSYNLDCLSGFGVLFGVFETAHKACALGSSLEIVLEKLSQEVSDTCSLKLVSDFYE